MRAFHRGSGIGLSGETLARRGSGCVCHGRAYVHRAGCANGGTLPKRVPSSDFGVCGAEHVVLPRRFVRDIVVVFYAVQEFGNHGGNPFGAIE